MKYSIIFLAILCGKFTYEEMSLFFVIGGVNHVGDQNLEHKHLQVSHPYKFLPRPPSYH